MHGELKTLVDYGQLVELKNLYIKGSCSVKELCRILSQLSEFILFKWIFCEEDLVCFTCSVKLSFTFSNFSTRLVCDVFIAVHTL